jgi:flagella basal body P-ring formation protein FlgA
MTAKDIIVPESGVSWQLMPANGQDFFGSLLFKVQAVSNTSNDVIYSNWIVAKLRIVKPVPLSNRTIPKGQPISKADIRWEAREITVFTRDALLDEREIVNQRAGRIIRPNSVITGKLLQKKYLVQRGGMATLIAQSNNVKATSRVKVLANGAYGDTIRVMNTGSKKILSAVVTGRNQVEVIVQ